MAFLKSDFSLSVALEILLPNKKILPIKKPNPSKKIIKIDNSFLLPQNKPTNKKNKIIVEKQKDVKKWNIS